MSISMYSASVPVFKQMLGALSAILTKAEAHAQQKKIDAAVLPGCRLAPDMFNLVRQVQIGADFAKSSLSRLAGKDVPAYEDSEQSFADLQARIAKTLDHVNSFSAADIDGSEEREIVLNAGTPRERRFAGQQYLVNYVMPNFFFHITTAYAILRHNGVELGKKDFMGAP
jgi:hypothetical protein